MNLQKEFEGAFANITFLEEQLHDFQQKHGYLQEELLLTKKETTHKSKYASKCATLSKRNSQDLNKDEQQLKQTHPNDIVDKI